MNLDESLIKITRGTGLALSGSLVGLFLAFIGRLLVARYGTEGEYGVFSLALVILSLCVVMATLGLQDGVSRSIAYARGRNDTERVQKLIPASIVFALAASLVLCFVLLFMSDIIAVGIFNEAALSFPLKVFAMAIPFVALINVLVSIFRGFGDVRPTVYFHNILRNMLFLLLLLVVMFVTLPFAWVFGAYLASLVICCICLAIYVIGKLPLSIRFAVRTNTAPEVRELLFFSLPLLGVAMLQMITVWTDTLMLGGLRSSAEVGLYSAAHPLSGFISFPLGVMLLIYMPITSGLYADGLIPEIRRNFSILTKWLCSATLPLFLILFLFPETVLSLLFGANYAPAANALRILSLGFMINNLLGPNGATLVALGESRFMMWATLVTAVLNVGLNVALIPPFGIEGAAIASISAITSVNLIRCWKLYSSSKAQPLSKNLLKPTIASLALVFLIYYISRSFLAITYWMLPFLFVLYYAIYGLAILFTKSFDREDVAILLAIEKRTGINASLIKKILRRFL